MPWAIPLALTAYSAIAGNQAKKKAEGLAGKAGEASQVDIAALDAKTREIALKNAHQSAELEKAMTPEVPELRSAANRGVINGLTPTAGENAAESYLLAQLGAEGQGAAQSPLLRAAIAKAKADLELGGNLSVETQNAATRNALATAGTVGRGGLGLGRDLVARDLGLTSLNLQDQRLRAASQLGQQELGMNQEANSHGLNLIQLLNSLNGDRFGRNLAAAQYGESIQRPIVGLDPGAVADLTVSNANGKASALSNQANIAGGTAQGYSNMAGQGLGMAAMMYGQSKAPAASTYTYKPQPAFNYSMAAPAAQIGFNYAFTR